MTFSVNVTGDNCLALKQLVRMSQQLWRVPSSDSHELVRMSQQLWRVPSTDSHELVRMSQQL